MINKIFLKHQNLIKKRKIEYSNIENLFLKKIIKLKKKNFITFPDSKIKKYTYQEFYHHVISAIQILDFYKIKKGEKISIIFYNQLEFLIFYFACLFRGFVAVPINPDLSSKEIDFIVKNSKSRLVFFTSIIEFKINKKFLKKNFYLKVITFNDFFKRFNLNNNRKKITNNKVNLHDEAVIIYTSGTTGNPKGVVLTHLNLLSDAKAISEWFKFNDKTITLCVLPLFHNNGQITTFLAPLYAGGSTVITVGKTNIMNFWHTVKKYKITWTSVMVSILSILTSLPFKKKNNSLKAILCGGQVLTRSLQKKFEDKFKVPVFEGYGLTETTSFACINDYPKKKRVIGSIGKPLPVNEMVIINDKNDNILGANQEGEICIRGFNVAKQYFKLHEKNKISFRNGWFHSGDYGYKDKNGYFYFNGRKDSLIIKGGENIYPAEIENALYKIKDINECAVIDIPDKFLGENICAFIEFKKNVSIKKEKIISLLSNHLAKFKLPKEIIILNKEKNLKKIPKGPTKKILYRKLRSYYEKKYK